MSNLALFAPESDPAPRTREPVFRVEVAGRWQPFLRPTIYEQSAGGVPRVRLELGAGRLVSGTNAWLVEAALRTIGPADLVTVDLVRSGALAARGAGSVRLFEGYIDGPEFSYSAADQAAGFWAADRAESLLARRVHGQFADAVAGRPTWLSGAELAFNQDGRPNMAPEAYVPATGRTRRLFAAPGAPDAEGWTYDLAADYLLSFYADAAWLVLPDAAELAALFGTDPVENLRLEGLGVMAALDRLADHVGLRPTVALSRAADGRLVRSLVFVGRGRGRTVSLYHQMPGETFTLARTAMESADVTIDWADAPASLHLVGDVKLYETTFDLVPGWDRSLEGQDREAYCRSRNPNFADVADVYRKWVLNEAGDYTAEPFSAGEAYDFAALFGHAGYLRRRRRFLPTISTDEAGESRGVYVELSTDGGATFVRPRGPVRVLRDECGIVLDADALPNEWFHAAERGQLAVRVTATVESDSRLGVVVERPGLADDHRGRRLWRDVSDRFQFRRVDAGSLFHGGPSRQVDDSDRLVALAANLWQRQRRATVPAKVGLPFFSVSYRVGDRIDGVRYRYAWLRRADSGLETDPYVAAIRQTWRDGEGWRTELSLV